MSSHRVTSALLCVFETDEVIEKEVRAETLPLQPGQHGAAVHCELAGKFSQLTFCL